MEAVVVFHDIFIENFLSLFKGLNIFFFHFEDDLVLDSLKETFNFTFSLRLVRCRVNELDVKFLKSTDKGAMFERGVLFF